MEKDFQRWTARRKVELLLQLIKGDTTVDDCSRECVWCPPGFRTGHAAIRSASPDTPAA